VRGIVVRPERCLACRACELACVLAHTAHGDLVRARLDAPLRRLRLRRHPTGWAPASCRHCAEPTCVLACMTGARSRGEEGVRTDEDRCLSCGMCYLACPTGAITRRGLALASCDRCGDGDPRCVRACPTGALRLVEGEAAPGIWLSCEERA